MQLYCPNCQAAYASAARCPRCDSRLVTPAEAFESAADLSGLPPPPLQPTALARTILGSVVALGLYVGLREWAAAGSLVSFGADPWEQAGGFVLAVVLRAIGAVVGGAVAGAGRPAGAGTGFLVGLASGAAAVAVDVVGGAEPAPVEVGVVAGLAVAAAVAGWVGSRVWPPAVELPAPVSRSRGSSLLHLARDDERHRAPKPTNWLRVLVGVTGVVCAVVIADTTRSALKQYSGGYLHLGGAAQAPIVCLEIAGLLILTWVPGAVAGTGAGLRHGLLIGTGAGAALAGMTTGDIAAVQPAVEGVLKLADLPTNELTSTPAAAAAFVATLLACTGAGWLGGTLLPPLASPEARARAKTSHEMV